LHWVAFSRLLLIMREPGLATLGLREETECLDFLPHTRKMARKRREGKNTLHGKESNGTDSHYILFY
jgi:hypothetical protein